MSFAASISDKEIVEVHPGADSEKEDFGVSEYVLRALGALSGEFSFSNRVETRIISSLS